MAQAGQRLLAASAVHGEQVVVGHLLVHQEVDVVLLVLAAQHLVKLGAESSKGRPQLAVFIPALEHHVVAEGGGGRSLQPTSVCVHNSHVLVAVLGLLQSVPSH